MIVSDGKIARPSAFDALHTTSDVGGLCAFPRMYAGIEAFGCIEPRYADTSMTRTLNKNNRPRRMQASFLVIGSPLSFKHEKGATEPTRYTKSVIVIKSPRPERAGINSQRDPK